MTELTNVLNRDYKVAKKSHIGFKKFNDPENRKIRGHCHYTNLYQGAVRKTCNQKY